MKLAIGNSDPVVATVDAFIASYQSWLDERAVDFAEAMIPGRGHPFSEGLVTALYITSPEARQRLLDYARNAPERVRSEKSWYRA
jgi:hypothetical protein